MRARSDAGGSSGMDAPAADTAPAGDAMADANAGDSAGAGAEVRASDADSGGTSSTDAAPDAAPSDAAPSTNALITFRLENTGTDTLYLRSGCTTPIKVTALADGTTYGNNFACACDCASASCNGTLACGACPPDNGIPIAPGSSTDVSWIAQWTATQTKTGPYGPFQCLQRGPIPTGPYTFAVAVYAAAADAAAGKNPRTVEKSFTLGSADATIEVPLS